MSTIGIPIKLLHEAEGHTVTIELRSGEVYRGHLVESEDNMNCHMKNVTLTSKDGRITALDSAYIRGSKIRYLIVPDMLKNAPMFRLDLKPGSKGKGMGFGINKGVGVTNLIKK